MKNIILKNGIRLVCCQMDNVHSVVFSVCFKGGSEQENKENCGIAHLTEHMFFRRANTLRQEELYRLTEEIGSDLRGTTYKEMIRFCMKTRPQFINKSLHILKQLLCDFEWTDEELNQERQVVLRELDEKYFDISEISDKVIFKDTPAAIPVIGTYESIMNITVDDINKFRQSLCCAQNTTVIVTGNVSDMDVELIKKEFEEVKIPGKTSKPDIVKASCCQRKPDVVLKAMGWDNAEIRLCFDVPEGISEPELMLLNSVLGGGVGSRLQMKLRENEGITADIRSAVISRCGMFKIYIDYTAECAEINKSLEMIQEILNEVKKDITQDEYNRNIVFFADNFMFDLDDTERMNENISWYMLYNSDLDYSVKDIADEYRSITIEKLQWCAQRIFVSENLTVVIAGKTDDLNEDVSLLLTSF